MDGDFLMELVLQVVPSSGDAFEFKLELESVVIGRSSSCDLVIDDQVVSRRHARLFLKEGAYHLEDLGSHNGTLLNGRKLAKPEPITPGAVIRLSGTVISVDEYRDQPRVSEGSQWSESGVFRRADDLVGNDTGITLGAADEPTLRRFADRLKVINQVHRALAKPIKKQALLEMILDNLFEVLHPEEGVIFLANSDGTLEPAAFRTAPGQTGKIFYSRTLVREVTEKGLVALSQDVFKDDRFADSESIIGSGIRSLLAAPLNDADGTLGMILLFSRAFVRRFTEDDMSLLASIAHAAAMRVRNLVLSEEAEERLRNTNRTLERKVQERTGELKRINEELESLDRMVRTTNRETELPKLLQTMLEQGLNLFPKADRGAVLLFDEERDGYHFAAVRGYDLEALKSEVFAQENMNERFLKYADEIEKDIYLIRDAMSLPNLPQVISASQPKSFLCLALRIDDLIYGLLVLDSRLDSKAFDHSDAQRLDRLREHAVIAVAKAKSFQDLVEKNRQILKTRNQLIVQEKMASLGTLTAGVAHEIKNPLNFINNFAEFSLELIQDLRDKFAPHRDTIPAEQAESIDDVIEDLVKNSELICKHGKKVNQIVQSMMELARTGSGKEDLVDFNSIVEKYGSLAFQGFQGGELKAPIQLEFRLDPNVPHLKIRPRSFSRALVNVVNNALESVAEKWRREGGNHYEPKVVVKTEYHEREVLFIVRDNGLGIAEELLNRIFSPFFTSKPAARNIGLGLWIAYDIVVKEHQGKINIRSEQGQYAEICISLPIDLAELP